MIRVRVFFSFSLVIKKSRDLQFCWRVIHRRRVSGARFNPVRARYASRVCRSLPPSVQCELWTAGHDVRRAVTRLDHQCKLDWLPPLPPLPITPPSSLLLTATPHTLSLSLSLLLSVARKDWHTHTHTHRGKAYITSAVGTAVEPRRPSADSEQRKTARNRSANARAKDAARVSKTPKVSLACRQPLLKKKQNNNKKTVMTLFFFQMEKLAFWNSRFMSLFASLALPKPPSVLPHRGGNKPGRGCLGIVRRDSEGKNTELRATWSLGLDVRQLIVQTVASVLGSDTAPLLFSCVQWGWWRQRDTVCRVPLYKTGRGLKWKVELKGMTVRDGQAQSASSAGRARQAGVKCKPIDVKSSGDGGLCSGSGLSILSKDQTRLYGGLPIAYLGVFFLS